MALIGYTITVVAKQDNPYNVLSETDISIRKNSDNSLVNIYADEAGLIPIPQIGAKTDSNGQFTFYADASLGILKAVWTNGGVTATEILDKNDHSKLVNRNAIGAHDAIYRRETTVAEIATGVFSVGDKLTVTDRANAQFNVVSGGTADGYGVLNAGTVKTASLDSEYRSVMLAYFGASGLSLNDGAVTYALNYGKMIDEMGGSVLVGNATFDGSVKIANVTFKSESAGTAIRNNRTPKFSSSVSISVSIGQTSVSIADAAIGDIVLLKGSAVRYPNVDGDYKYGQLVKVVNKVGSLCDFYPAIAEAFTVTTIDIYAGYTLELDNVTFDASSNTNTNSLFVADYMANPRATNIKLIGGGNQNIGAIFTGVGIRVDNPLIENFSNNSLGYALGFNGSDIIVTNPTAAKGRHVIEGNTDRLCMSVGFKVLGGNITKDSTASVFTYVIGAHSNAVNPVYDGISVGGSGFLIGIRGGNGTVKNCDLNMLSNSNYSPVLVTEKGVSGLHVVGNTYSSGSGYMLYISTDQDNKNIIFDSNISKGRKTVIKLPASLRTDNLSITNNKGVSAAVFDFNIQLASLNNFTFDNNDFETALPFSSPYFIDLHNAGSFTNASICGNNVDDSQLTGFLRVGDITGVLSMDVKDNTNAQAFKAIELNSPLIGGISHLDIVGNNFAGRCRLNFAGGQVFSTIVNFKGNDLKNTGADSFTSTSSPIRFGDNTVNSASNITVNSTYQPTSGNSNIGAGEIIYNGSTVNFNGTLT